MKRFAAKVDKAVFEADVFRIVGLSEYRQRQFLRGGQDFDLARENFDLAGGQVRIHRLGSARLDVAIDTNHPFAPNGLSDLERRGIWIGNDLRQAVMVAQIDEQQTAMVADAMHPARKTGGLTDIAFAQLRAVMAAITMHTVLSEV